MIKKPSEYLDLNWKHSLFEWPILHPAIPKSTQLNFWGTDSQKLFEKNKLTAPDNWCYRDTEIVYNFNAHGLRQQKELSEIDQDNYLFSTGGCFNLGVGIREEDRYANIVSSSLGMDLVSWGTPLGSLKYQTINFMNFLNVAPKLPKIVISNYSPYATTVFYSKGEFLLYTEDIMAADPVKFPDYLEAYTHLLKTDYSLQEGFLWQHIMKTTCKKLGIKYIDTSFFADDPFTLENGVLTVDVHKQLDDINYTWARDYRAEAVAKSPYSSHPGAGRNRELAELILHNI